MKKCMLIVISLGLLFIGCSNYENTNSQEDYERQVKEYNIQAQRVNKQLAEAEEQQQRMDRLLDRWEKQADRYDSILDKMENQR